MSRPGDVVWSRGRAWLCRNDYFGGAGKLWWMACTEAVCEALAYLREHDDFRWLVKDGKRVVHADDCPPQVAYEAYTFQIANLTELLAQAEKDRDMHASGWDRLIAESDRAWNELASMTAMRDAARKDALEAVAAHKKLAAHYAAKFTRRVSENKELRDLRQELAAMTNQRDVAENRYADALAGQLSRAALEERAAIVAWLLGNGLLHIANSIESGEHLAGDDA